MADPGQSRLLPVKPPEGFALPERKPKITNVEGNPDPHFHLNKVGHLEACYHKCRTLLSPGFWLGITFSFPLEHVLWEKAPLFSDLTHYLGL